ncbi:hypothetical protein, partial [Verminephrobacter eiseniae]|uniref:hypothetical protein n=1 Tax=Verminephrobacter eiseniae TaxID=364317 RepID=UPI002244C7B7
NGSHVEGGRCVGLPSNAHYAERVRSQILAVSSGRAKKPVIDDEEGSRRLASSSSIAAAILGMTRMVHQAPMAAVIPRI